MPQPLLIVAALIVGGTGIACVGWPVEVTAFFRWYHSKKPQWIQDLPFADTVMRPWMPTYVRIMGLFFCAFALVMIL